jgi:hypothetical protein
MPAINQSIAGVARSHFTPPKLNSPYASPFSVTLCE